MSQSGELAVPQSGETVVSVSQLRDKAAELMANIPQSKDCGGALAQMTQAASFLFQAREIQRGQETKVLAAFAEAAKDMASSSSYSLAPQAKQALKRAGESRRRRLKRQDPAGACAGSCGVCATASGIKGGGVRILVHTCTCLLQGCAYIMVSHMPASSE